MDGLRWLCHLSLHCFPILLLKFWAIEDQFFAPNFFTRHLSNSSSSLDQLPLKLALLGFLFFLIFLLVKISPPEKPLSLGSWGWLFIWIGEKGNEFWLNILLWGFWVCLCEGDWVYCTLVQMFSFWIFFIAKYKIVICSKNRRFKLQ